MRKEHALIPSSLPTHAFFPLSPSAFLSLIAYGPQDWTSTWEREQVDLIYASSFAAAGFDLTLSSTIPISPFLCPLS